ncbi:hypothetical protein [Vibrio mangrovi]|uniref:SMODS-associated and fused to various effectors domain-containing protein n=1 Tax=Vibrio mangrovi TaxID=474394 RepID=A0A1Y6IQI7_9VIBR|nr:hypothetical protein [Vibrio mangrovi]MDW6003304.1 hypothetical protein [Vibrio mangrovi]SMR99907.1 hypothetical protein VIM7927_01145 [Vibrio mangrovi]
MKNVRIKDLPRSEIMQTQFDLGIFSVGYEPRCIHLAGLLERQNIGHTLVLSYEESAQNDVHRTNQSLFKSMGYTNFVSLKHCEIKLAYQSLIQTMERLENIDGVYKIFIDYSSMSRNWYSAILNYLLNYFKKPIEITMVYSCAEYPLNSGFLDFELGEVKVLPGCQGSSITKKKKASIFMLGFDRIGPLSFYNLLEPDIAYGMISSPGSLPDYEETARTINGQFIQHQLNNGEKLVGSPIFSVAQTFENLCQLIRPIVDKYNVSIVQFGPKPHLLASIIAGLNFQGVSCIYSEYKRNKPHNVKANGEFVMTSISSGL